MLSAKNVVKPGYSVFIRQTTSAGLVWLLTTLSHSLYIAYRLPKLTLTFDSTTDDQ